MSERRAKALIEIGATTRGMDRGLSDARSKMRGFAAFAKKSVVDAGGRAARSVAGGLGAGFGHQLAGGATQVIANSVERLMSYEQALLKVQLATGKNDEQMREVESTVASLSSTYGMSKDAIAGIGDAYFNATSDGEGLLDAMTNITKASKATFASTDATTKVFAALQDSMQIDSKKILATYSGLIAQADKGKIPLAEANNQLAELLPMFAQFGVVGHEGAAQMFALYQVIAKGSGTADKAKEDFKALMSVLTGKSKQLAKYKIQVFDMGADGVKRPREAKKILDDIANSKLGKNPDLLKDVFGSDLAVNAFNQLARLPGMYDDIYRAAEKTTTVEERLAKIQESRGDRVQKAKQNVENTLDKAVSGAVELADMSITGWKLLHGAVTGDALRLDAGFDDESDVVRNMFGTKATPDIIEHEAGKRNAQFLPALMQGREDWRGRRVGGLQGKGAAEYEEQAKVLQELAGKYTTEAMRGGDPTLQLRVEALALENAARYLMTTAEAMKHSGVGGAAVKLFEQALAKAQIKVLLGDSAISNAVDASKTARGTKGKKT